MKFKTVLSLSLSAFALQAFAETTAELNILETTDIHTHIVDYDYYGDKPSSKVGLARTATLIRQMRDSLPNTILVDNGDLIQGNPLGDYMAREKGLDEGNIHPVYKAMNILQYDVGNLGNHEFNYGLDFLSKALKGADFPYVSTNTIYEDGKHLVNPYVILDKEISDNEGKKHTIKVAVMGFVPPQIMQWDARHLKGKVKALDIMEAAQKTLDEIKTTDADIVLAIAHSGINTKDSVGMDENAAYYLSQLKGLDGLLLGHSHAVFPSSAFADLPNVDVQKGTINGVAAAMPGFWGSHLGRIQLTLSLADDGQWNVEDGQGSVMSIYKQEGKETTALVEADAEIIESVKEEHEGTIAYMNTDVGKASAPIHSYFALVQDDPSIQIVTAAQKAYVEKIIEGTELDGLPVLSAGAPFKAGGRGGADYYTNIPAGPLKLKNVSDLYIFPNTLQVVRLTGADVVEWLEMSALAFNQIDPQATEEQALLNPDFRSYNFDVIDGISYEFDVTQAPRYNFDGEKIADSHRVVNVMFEGKPIDLSQEFLVATNNYRAQGGGKFPKLDGSTVIIEAPDENRNVLASYIQDEKDINPSADSNWRFKDNLQNAYITFTTGGKAVDYLGEDVPFEKVKDGEDGFVIFKFK